MPIPEQASTPWMSTVLLTPRVSLANAGKAASITWEIAQKVARPMMDNQIAELWPMTDRLRLR